MSITFLLAVDVALLLVTVAKFRSTAQQKQKKIKSMSGDDSNGSAGTSFKRVPVQDLPKLQDDCILQAMYGKPTKRIPVWIMRQAGRYLPEFRALRVEHEFFKAMGMEVQMVPGKGPVFPQRLDRPSDAVKRLVMKPDVEKTLGYVVDALNLTRQELKGRVPLIGFSGAPFTLMAYMIEGGGSKTLSRAKRFLYEEPEDCHALLQAITDVIVEYLVNQVTLGGAQALQVFESNAGDLSPRLWNDFSLPYLAQIAKRVKQKLGNSKRVPLVVFSRGSNWEGTLEALAETEYDTVGLDWTIDPSEARKRVAGKKSLQGNLDPATLFAPPAKIRQEVFEMLTKFGTKQGLVANLGHGMEPDMNPEHAKAFLEAVRDFSSSSLL